MQPDSRKPIVCPMPPRSLSRFWPLFALTALLVLVTAIRLRVASSPLERDEGEYAFLGQLMLQGIPPYTEAANMKFPGTYAAFAIIEAVFGQTTEGIHHGLLVINLATILLMYHLGKVIFERRHIALMAATIYALSSLSYSFFGAMAHATHFVVFFGLAGVALLLAALKGKSPPSFALAGAVTGLAYLAKQSGFYFVPFGCLLILGSNNWRLFSVPTLRGLVYFVIGAFSPFALTVFVFQQLGCLDSFVFWTLRYAATYGPTLADAPRYLAAHVESIVQNGLGWLFLFPGLLFFLPTVWRTTFLARRTMILLSLFFVLSLAGVSLGLTFRQHYWIQILPSISLLAALFFSTAGEWICRPGTRQALLVSFSFCLIFCSAVLIRESPRFFRTAPDEIIREIYGGNPFVESVTIANFINRHSDPRDRIFVFGNEPEIYFYAKRHSASSFIYLFSLFENQPYAVKMQLQLLSEVTLNRPRYIVEAHIFGYSVALEKDFPLYQWKTAYLAEYYRPLFAFDLSSPENKIFFGNDVRDQTLITGRFIAVWEKKSD